MDYNKVNDNISIYVNDITEEKVESKELRVGDRSVVDEQ